MTDTLTDLEMLYDCNTWAKVPNPVVVSGQGSYVRDADGNEYLDCLGYYGALILGHCHPRVVDAICTQAQKIIGYPNLFTNPTRGAFLDAIVSLMPAPLNSVYLCSSGTEAIETAIKFAISKTRKHKLVSCKRGYHGMTMGSLGVSSQDFFREPFEAGLNKAQFVEYGNIADLERAITDETAMFIMEPIQSAMSGVFPPDRAFTERARELCDQHGALLVFDEILTGLGRTGKVFAMDHINVVPDAIAIGKGFSGGLPFGAVITSKEVTDAMPEGLSHSSTHQGNITVAAAGLATIKAVFDEQMIDNAVKQGEKIRQALRELPSNHIKEVRGEGLLIGIEVNDAIPYCHTLLEEHHIIAGMGGPTSASTCPVIVLLPPLNISDSDTDKLIQALCSVLG